MKNSWYGGMYVCYCIHFDFACFLVMINIKIATVCREGHTMKWCKVVDQDE